MSDKKQIDPNNPPPVTEEQKQRYQELVEQINDIRSDLMEHFARDFLSEIFGESVEGNQSEELADKGIELTKQLLWEMLSDAWGQAGREMYRRLEPLIGKIQKEPGLDDKLVIIHRLAIERLPISAAEIVLNYIEKNYA